ncbi:hypothetical protein GCM10011490_22790 [Pseudoclavibacter endophyticus]|uniref:response regulator n=1 Tax=Pseudoclavibacter endophyticus TaxID=1778590 RepID=UPI001669983A|nr:response regulator [Pseudoclavibacter endophyticus]GGA71528.1 hypothetical protein GCM10011490_22790 [Pseudoclavibacter endophyticus]
MTGTTPLVLVLDDTTDQRELLRVHLERAGCRVDVAATLSEAEERVRHEAPDIAVIDLLLGDENGWDAQKRLRELSPRTAIVISSVLDAADYPCADAVLPKPFTRTQVAEIVHELRRSA